ncbi:MAG: hypothetical protein KBC88_03270 [Alphaproteobacteria bacterium]|nr:hypothetical protein [Alphaproteobacteria bacterium]
MSERETGTIDAEQKALEEIGIPRDVQEGIKTLVTGSSNAMERYDVAARAAADHVERVEPSDKACNRLLSALYLHGETVKLRETFTTSSTGLPALDEALKRGTAEDALEAENLKQDTSGPVASCLAKSLLPQR